MKLPITSITPFTFQDYPEHTACILWFSGCNMRCLYCHNPELVNGDDLDLSAARAFLSNTPGDTQINLDDMEARIMDGACHGDQYVSLAYVVGAATPVASSRAPLVSNRLFALNPLGWESTFIQNNLRVSGRRDIAVTAATDFLRYMGYDLNIASPTQDMVSIETDGRVVQALLVYQSQGQSFSDQMSVYALVHQVRSVSAYRAQVGAAAIGGSANIFPNENPSADVIDEPVEGEETELPPEQVRALDATCQIPLTRQL